jgi:O-antigen ligase
MSVAIIGVVVSLGMYEMFVNVVTMGRDDSETSSLTGRVPLWQELLTDYVSERPLIGHGYGAFWSPTHISEISKSQTWQVASTHSAYIDLFLNSGGIGAVLCLWAMVLACVVALRLERRHANVGYGVIGMILAYGLVAGFFETTIGTTCFLSFFRISGVCFLMYSAGRHAERTLADLDSQEIAHYPSRVRAGAIA